jgi:uncharacterized protein YqiB (DUF1249 family)
MHRKTLTVALCNMILMLFTVTSCDGRTVTPSTEGGNSAFPLWTKVQVADEAQVQQVDESCEACAQATLASALTQQKIYADNQAAATAEVERANAQATVNSAIATLSAAQTQSQNNANVLAGQIAATAEIVRANAQATVNAAGATQIAAMTQAQYNLQVTELVRTQVALALLTQQSRDEFAASTQTAIANNVSTQTQSAAATSEWYADQERQRNEQRQGPIIFLWTWCFPIFIVLLAGLGLWGFRRWLSIQQSNQRILEKPVERLPEPVMAVRPHWHDDSMEIIESDNVPRTGYEVTTPDDQVHQWLDEVKDELLNDDKKDKNNGSTE